MSVRYGIKYDDFVVDHPITHEPHVVSVCIEYEDCDETRDTPASFDYEYKIESVENGNGDVVEYRSWLTHNLIKDKIQQIADNIL